MQYQYVLQSNKSKRFWSNNAGWTKKLSNASLYEEGHIIAPPDKMTIVKVKVFSRVVKA